MSVKTKIWKKQWELFSFSEFMRKPRFIKSYEVKKTFLGMFLVIVIGYTGFNVSLQVPEISIKWSSDPITFERPVEAKFEVKEAIVKEVEITDCYTASEVMGKKYSVPVELLKKIVKAESGNNHLVENKVSTATGCSQWVLGSWRSYGKILWGDEFHSKNIYSPRDNVELLAWTIANYGTSPWDASRAVWSR
jgi:hypothetical protein